MLRPVERRPQNCSGDNVPATDGTAAGRDRGFQRRHRHSCDAEVDDLDHWCLGVGAREDDVLGLEVAVDHPDRCCFVERARDLEPIDTPAGKARTSGGTSASRSPEMYSITSTAWPSSSPKSLTSRTVLPGA